MILGNTFRLFRNNIFLNKDEAFFINYFKSSDIITDKKLNILIQMPESYSYVALFGLVLKVLRKKSSLNINWINVNCEFQRVGKGAFLKRNSFFERKWTKIYTSFGGKVGFSNLIYSFDDDILSDSKKLFTSLTTKQELLALTYKEIHIGDLVYDTYLRFKPAPTVDIKDEFLKRILNSALQLVKNSDAFIKKSKPDYLITSYCSYIHHGIMTRVALKNEIKVITICHFDHFSKKVTADFPSHSKNYYEYKELFKTIAENKKVEFKNLAKDNLEVRFKGKNDQGTYYMRQSAYGQETSEKIFTNTGRKRAVIFLHCFFDSPHIYRYMHYLDFNEWTDRILTLASESNFDFYVKAHPNGMLGNVSIVEKFKKKFPTVKFISPTTSNNQLIKEGFDVAFTIYGTLGHEFPYFGIPVVHAGDNPHINYNFCKNTESRDEYEWFVKNIDKVPPVPADAKDQIWEFFYMHNFYQFPGKLGHEENEIVKNSLRFIGTSNELKNFAVKCSNDHNYQEKIEELIAKSLDEVL